METAAGDGGGSASDPASGPPEGLTEKIGLKSELRIDMTEV